MTIGFIGAGNMAGAIIQGIARTSEMPIAAYDIDTKKTDALKKSCGIQVTEDLSSLIEMSDYILLGVKPYQIEHILQTQKQALVGKPCISIALGWGLADYQRILGEQAEILCVMPNTPCKVLSGIFLINEKHSFNQAHLDEVLNLLRPLGEVRIMPDHLMNVAGTLSGCGPAYAYMIIEALADGAVKHGLDRESAIALASQMLAGSAKMVLETHEHPAKLKDDVCSPGGSTILGVEALYESGIYQAMIKAISAAVNHH